MRALVAVLVAAAVFGPATADRFRTVRVGDHTDWASLGGHGDCDICDGGHDLRDHVQSHRSSSHQRFSGPGGTPSGGGPPRGFGFSGGHGVMPRSGRRTYHYSSEESEYTFSNGTHSTTITSKRSTEGVPEFHLKMTRLRDGAVIESTVLSEAEYRERRASLGLTGSDGSFGFESLGGGGDGGGLSSRHLSGEELFADLERRFGRRHGGRGGYSRHSTNSFSSEESYYSFSNGTHTTSIKGHRNSDGVREYGLELIRDADGTVLDRATISEAEYNRRRQSMTGGGGFDDVFAVHGIHGSGGGSRTELDTRSSFDSRSRSHGYGPSAPTEPTGSSVGSSGSRSTYFRREERTEETRREETDDACSCVKRTRCRYSNRVITAEALLRCDAGEVCCRQPISDPRPARPERPAAEPQRNSPDCRCVPRDSCTYQQREYSLAALQKCHSPMVCCRHRADQPRLSTPSPTSPPRPDPRPARPVRPTARPTTDPAFIQEQRDLFRDIVQHVDLDEAPVQQRPVGANSLQSAPTRPDRGHRRVEYSRSEHSRTESGRGAADAQRRRDFDVADRLQPVDGDEQTVSSSRRYSFHSSTSGSSGGHGRRTDDFDTHRLSQQPLDASGGTTQTSQRSYSYRRTSSGASGDVGLNAGAAGGRHDASRSWRRAPGDSSDELDEQGGARVVTSSHRFSERRTVSSDDDDEYPILGSGSAGSRYRSSHRAEQHAAQEPVDLPGPQLTSSSSRHYSYRSSSSSSSDDHSESDRLLGADGAGQRRIDTGRRLGGSEFGQPNTVTSSSRRYSSERTVSGHSDLADSVQSPSASGFGSSGAGELGDGSSVSTSSHRYSVQRTVSGDAAGADLGHGAGLSARLGGGHSSGSRYSSSSSWSSQSSSGLAGSPDHSFSHHSVPSSSGGSSGSGYRYSSSRHSSQQQVPVTGSSYWSSYSQQTQRHRRGWWPFGSRDQTPTPYVDPHSGDTCTCVRFDQCMDGNLIHHGADLLDISIGPRKQCSGFRVCCDTPPEVLSRLQSTANLREGVMTRVPTAGLDFSSLGSSSLAPHAAGSRPCVCVSSYLCQGGEIRASQQLLVDMRQVSQTGRCSYSGQVCCAVPWQQVQTTPPPPPCTCVTNTLCRQQDVLSRYVNANAPTCPGTQVCCTRPQQPSAGYGGSVQPDRLRDPDYDLYKFCKSYPLSVACSSTHRFNTLPTITPSPYFNADADARRLSDAMGLLNADDEVLIDVLTKRTFQERGQIKAAFARLYGTNLVDKIVRTTRGKFEDLMEELLEASSYEEYLARKLHKGMDGTGTDEDAVLETLISCTNGEIAAIEPHFQNVAKHTLYDDVRDDLTGDLEDLMLALVNGTRDNSLRVDRLNAEQQARALYKAGGSRLGTEEETFKYYLTHENYAQLALIFSAYEQLAGESFEEALEDEFSRHTEDAVLAIVAVTKNLPRYFATRLHDALWGRGLISKDDSSLRRIIISRAERDLGTIAQEYYLLYGRTLVDDIEKKTTGDYEDALVSLVGGQS